MVSILIRSIDFETSDMKPPEAEVIEIGATDIVFDTDTRSALITKPMSLLFKPTRPLKPENIAVHHLTDARLQDSPICAEKDLRMLVESATPMFLAAHNWAYEAQWMTPAIMGEAKPLCTLKAAYRLFPDQATHNLQTMRYALGLELDDALALPAHRAGPDSYVGAHILAKMLETTPVRDIYRWTLEPRHYPVCPLKKHKGQPWPTVPFDYLLWIIRDIDMEHDIKCAADDEIRARREAQLAKTQGAPT